MISRSGIRKALILLGAALAIIAVATALELFFLEIETTTFGARILFLFLLNLNVMALLGIVFFVGKNIALLFRERKLGILGHKFKIRILAFFMVLISIPSVLLFIVAGGLGTNYIDRFFTPQFRKPMESSLEMAKSLYDMVREQTLQYAELARQGQQLPPQYRVTHLDTLPEEPSETITAAFRGEHGAEIVTSGDADMVRVALPGADDGGGIIVVETALPADITENVAMIQTAYQDFLTLERWRIPLKMNYLLILGFFTLFIIFSAFWVALKITGSITVPVRDLAEATEQVASGSLDVRVVSTTQDEFALLIESFNRMVRELREGKESLERAYLNMENIVKSIHSGVISLDAKTDVQAINAAACNILGVNQEDALGKHYDHILRLMQSEELRQMIIDINLRYFQELERELWVTIGGRTVLLKIYITAIKGSAGENLGLLVVFDDLTNVVKAQRAVAWQEVARRMAHEIKNPLTPIKLSTERMLKKWQKQDPEFGGIFERSTRTIIAEVDSLKRLVDEFSRLGTMPELSREPSDVLSIVKEVIELYRSYKSLSVHVEAGERLVPAHLDRDQFKRVLINLFDNAVEALRGSGVITVTLTAYEAANKLVVELADSGPGIRDEDKEKLFLPYFSTRKNGTGLGLAIADKIISEHGGSLRVRDNLPQGSVFTVEIPIREA
jgi:two-component system nitrogen regulation sensor histidine kinase NtrY